MLRRLPSILVILLALGSIGACAYETLYFGNVEILTAEEPEEIEEVTEEEAISGEELLREEVQSI